MAKKNNVRTVNTHWKGAALATAKMDGTGMHTSVAFSKMKNSHSEGLMTPVTNGKKKIVKIKNRTA